MSETAYFIICTNPELEIIMIGKVPDGGVIYVEEGSNPYPITESEYGTYLAFDLFPHYEHPGYEDPPLRQWYMYTDHGHYEDGGSYIQTTNGVKVS